MRGLLKFLAFLLIVALVGGAAAWLWSSREEGPRIDLRQPDRFNGGPVRVEPAHQEARQQRAVYEKASAGPAAKNERLRRQRCREAGKIAHRPQTGEPAQNPHVALLDEFNVRRAGFRIRIRF